MTSYDCWFAGKVVKTSHNDYSKDTAGGKWPPALLMGWCELRDGLADHVPTTAVELGRRFSHLEQHQDHVTVHFRSSASIDAKIVVGADGIFSKVRQQTLNDGLPQFTVSQSLPFTTAEVYVLEACCPHGGHRTGDSYNSVSLNAFTVMLLASVMCVKSLKGICLWFSCKSDVPAPKLQAPCMMYSCATQLATTSSYLQVPIHLPRPPPLSFPPSPPAPRHPLNHPPNKGHVWFLRL